MSNTMELDIKSLIGEATAYDKKQMLEIRRPKSWLKSVSAFANGEGGILVFGISDDDQILGLADAEGDAEKISEEIKAAVDYIVTYRQDDMSRPKPSSIIKLSAGGVIQIIRP